MNGDDDDGDTGDDDNGGDGYVEDGDTMVMFMGIVM